MDLENDYVDHFYEKNEGRVALDVGYDQNFSEVYPFVFEDSDGKSIGVVALAVYTHGKKNYVHIYHMGSFMGNRGNGSRILEELCSQADKYQISLSLSPISMPNGKNIPMSDEQLRSWYAKFGFRDGSLFSRKPRET